jgi:hypothetical protein
MSKFQKEFEDVRCNRFIFDGMLWGVYKFVDTEGFKSQPLAFVVGTEETGLHYSFVKN